MRMIRRIAQNIWLLVGNDIPNGLLRGLGRELL